MTISFSGLATGLDTQSIVDQLVAAEKQPAQLLATRKNQASSRLSLVNSLVSRLTALKTAATALNTPAEVRSLSVSSANESVVKVTGSGAAQPASLLVRVSSLARAQTSASQVYGTDTDGTAGVGSLSIKVGAGAPVAINYGVTDSLTDIAGKINQQVTGADAQVVNTGAGYRLVIGAEGTGSAGALTFVEGGAGLGVTTEVPASDAVFTVNGVSITRSSNTVSDALAGLTFTLVAEQALTDAPVAVSVAHDPDGLASKLKTVVDSFNGVVDLVNNQLTYAGVKRGGETLFSDPTVRALQRRLGQVAGAVYDHGGEDSSLTAIGITRGRDGRLSIDGSKLEAAIAADPTSVEDVIGGPAGLAVELGKMVDTYTRAGDGFLSAKKSAISNEMARYDDQITRIETRATAIGDQLAAQFRALEALISNFQSQQAALAALTG